MSKQISPLLIIGGAAAAYLLLSNSSSNGATNPIAAGPAVQSLASLLPGSTTATTTIPTTYGINSGQLGGDGSFYTVSNYTQLLAANPNLGNPNYQMTAAENSQYLANYLNLQQGLPTWINQKDLLGQKVNTLAQAAQAHWTEYGCASKMIFLPLQPPSNANFIPPPVPPKKASSSSTGTVVTSALKIAATVLPFILGETDEATLSAADQQILFSGAAILYDILPLYANADPQLTGMIKNKLDSLLKQYS